MSDTQPEPELSGSGSDLSNFRAASELAGLTEAERGAEVPLALQLQERHPDWPELRVKVLLDPHVYKADAALLAPALLETDVFVPEISGWRPTSLDYYQAIADGEVSTSDYEPGLIGIGGAAAEKYRQVAGTGVAIMLLDTPADTELNQALVQHFDVDRKAYRQAAFTYPSLTESLAATRVLHHREADLQRQRELGQMDDFEMRLAELFERRPTLKDKPSLRIVMSIGGFHATLRDDFVTEGFTTDQVEPDPELPPYAQLTATYMKNEEPDDNLVSRAWFADQALHSLVAETAGRASGRSDVAARLENSIVDRLERADFEDFYADVQATGDRRQSLLTLLEHKNIIAYDDDSRRQWRYVM